MTRYCILILATACAPTTGVVRLGGDPIVDPQTPSRVWIAQWLIGGLDRIVLYGEQEENPACVSLRLVSPGYDGSPFNELQINEPWGLEVVGSSTLACDPNDGWDSVTDQATAIVGTIEVQGDYPPQAVIVDVQVTLKDGRVETIDTRVEIDEG